MRKRESAYIRGFLHVFAGLILHMHSDFQNVIEDKFFAFMLRFGTNPTSSRDHSKPFFFSYYEKAYMVYFQNTQKSHGKRLRFTRNSESKESFSQNILKSIFF